MAQLVYDEIISQGDKKRNLTSNIQIIQCTVNTAGTKHLRAYASILHCFYLCSKYIFIKMYEHNKKVKSWIYKTNISLHISEFTNWW